MARGRPHNAAAPASTSASEVDPVQHRERGQDTSRERPALRACVVASAVVRADVMARLEERDDRCERDRRAARPRDRGEQQRRQDEHDAQQDRGRRDPPSPPPHERGRAQCHAGDLDEPDDPLHDEMRCEDFVNGREHPQTAGPVEPQEVLVGDGAVQHPVGQHEHEALFHRRAGGVQRRAQGSSNATSATMTIVGQPVLRAGDVEGSTASGVTGAAGSCRTLAGWITLPSFAPYTCARVSTPGREGRTLRPANREACGVGHVPTILTTTTTRRRRVSALDEPVNEPTTAPKVVVIGAGPAGLTAAYVLAKQGVTSTVLESDTVVGGISRTAERDGWRFDIGGHRFFTKVQAGRGPVVRDPRARRLPPPAAPEPHLLPRQVLRLPDRRR